MWVSLVIQFIKQETCFAKLVYSMTFEVSLPLNDYNYDSRLDYY